MIVSQIIVGGEHARWHICNMSHGDSTRAHTVGHTMGNGDRKRKSKPRRGINALCFSVTEPTSGKQASDTAGGSFLVGLFGEHGQYRYYPLEDLTLTGNS